MTIQKLFFEGKHKIGFPFHEGTGKGIINTAYTVQYGDTAKLDFIEII